MSGTSIPNFTLCTFYLGTTTSGVTAYTAVMLAMASDVVRTNSILLRRINHRIQIKPQTVLTYVFSQVNSGQEPSCTTEIKNYSQIYI
jgi:hypothetical protein